MSRGAVWSERAGARTPAAVGTRVQASDDLVTGADGSVGITLADDSRLSIGPNSVLALDRFAPDPTTTRASETARQVLDSAYATARLMQPARLEPGRSTADEVDRGRGPEGRRRR